MSLQQLRYAGVFEAVRIRQTGYPFRYSHENFLKRYGFLVKDIHKRYGPNLKQNCDLLLKSMKGDWAKVQGTNVLCQGVVSGVGNSLACGWCAVGKTRVLYRAPEQRGLELQRNIAVERVTIQIQAGVRRMFARRLYKRMRAIKPVLLNAIKSRSLSVLEQAIDAAKDIEFDMKLIRDCKELRSVILKEMEITKKLTEYIGAPPNHKVHASFMSRRLYKPHTHSSLVLTFIIRPTCKWSRSTPSCAGCSPKPRASTTRPRSWRPVSRSST
jgi:myosin heavy subunit